MSHQTSFSNRGYFVSIFFKLAVLWCLFLTSGAVFSQNTANEAKNTESDQKLLDQFIQSKGKGIITFDASNIKQFWIDNSVIARKDYFEIFLNKGTSIPLKLQLANVSGAQNCKIEVISETPDIAFTVSDMNSKKISSSSQDNSFVNYNVFSSSFSLEDILINYSPEYNFCFQLIFNAPNCESINIKAIVLSFSDNGNVISNLSGTLALTSEDIVIQRAVIESENQDGSFSVTGKKSRISTKKSFFVADKAFTVSVKIKNTGKSTTKVYIGYNVYSGQHILIDSGSYPYKNVNKVLNVISVEKGGNSIIVDLYPEWNKGGLVSLNAREDLSDIPSVSFLEGNIEEVKELEGGRAEIIMNKPINSALKPGDKIRINNAFGKSLYSKTINLQPGEENVFTHTIKKDNDFIQYSAKAFSRGVYYFRPLILSYSLESKEENTIQITEYTVQH